MLAPREDSDQHGKQANEVRIFDKLRNHTIFMLGLIPVILLPARPASFAHNFVSGMQFFYLDAIVLQTCH